MDVSSIVLKVIKELLNLSEHERSLGTSKSKIIIINSIKVAI